MPEENFVDQIKLRGQLFTSPGFGLDGNSATWLQLPNPTNGAKWVALSIGSRSDCDTVIVETPNYKGPNALVLTVGHPLVGPFEGPITIRPYYTLVGITTLGYQVEIEAWHELPRAFSTSRAPKAYCGPMTPYLGGDWNAPTNSNTSLWCMGRRTAKVSVWNNTAAPINVSMEALFVAAPNLIEPTNVRQSSTPAPANLDPAYVAAWAVGAGAQDWRDIPLRGAPMLIMLLSDTSDVAIQAQVVLVGEENGG